MKYENIVHCISIPLTEYFYFPLYDYLKFGILV